jgi:hypothetical protein
MSNEPGRTHDAEHERVLEELMTGQMLPDDPAAVLLRQCADCRERLQRLQRVTNLLDTAGSERRAILDEAVERRGPTRARPTTTMPRRRRPILVAAAAVLVAAALLYVPMRGCADSRPGDNTLLGPGSTGTEGYSPRGEAKEFTPFRWPAQELMLDEAYVIQVFEVDASGAPSPQPIAESKELQVSSWTPEGAELARVQACVRIQWRVVVRNLATGAPRPLQPVEAHRR